MLILFLFTIFLLNLSYCRDKYKEGPWRATLNPSIYHEFMKFYPDREVREAFWKGYNMRGSHRLSKEFNTNEHVGAIRALR